MAGKGRGGDGLKYLGVRNGRKWWEARLVWTDPRTGKKRNTKQEFQADSKLLAAQERASRIERMRDAATERRERKRFHEAIDAFLETVDVHSTKLSWGSFARRLKAQFGDWWIDAVTERHLQDYLDSLELSPSSIASLRAILRKTYAHAIRKGWATTNPAKELYQRDGTRQRARAEALGDAPKRSLTLDEAAAYLADLKAHEPHELYLLLATQMVLGARYAEVSALKWEDIDLENGVVTIRRGQVAGVFGPTKGKYARIAAIDLELRRELKLHGEAMRMQKWPGWETLVFPRRPTGNRRAGDAWARSSVHFAIKRSFARLGWDLPVGTHVARHTMHNVAREHASALLLRKVVGHKTERMQLTYTNAEKAEVINLAERVSSAIRSAKREP